MTEASVAPCVLSRSAETCGSVGHLRTGYDRWVPGGNEQRPAKRISVNSGAVPVEVSQGVTFGRQAYTILSEFISSL